MAHARLSPLDVVDTIRHAMAVASVQRLSMRTDRPGRRAPTVLPDAAAIDVGAYACHRVGLTGDGVRIGLSDCGIGSAEYFGARCYRIEGNRTDSQGHGTGMAAVLLAIAPDATVVSRPAGAEALGELLRSPGIDLILCAWGDREAVPALRFAGGPPVIAADPGPPGSWPASAGDVTGVRMDTRWPAGPYTLPGGRHSWAGASVAAAACCAAIALAIGGGVPAGAAVELAVPANRTSSEKGA